MSEFVKEYLEIYKSVMEIGLNLNYSMRLVVNSTSNIGYYYSILQQVTTDEPNIIIVYYVQLLVGSKIFYIKRRMSNLIGNDETSIGRAVVDVKLLNIVEKVPAKTIAYRKHHDNRVNYLKQQLI